MNLLYCLTICLFLSQINCLIRPLPIQPTFKTISIRSSEEKKKTNILSKLHSRDDSEEFQSLSISYCDHEEYLHKFISYDNKSQMIWVTWNRTKVGERAVLPNICSVGNGLPLRRRCLLPSHSKIAEWESYQNETVMTDCRISMYCQPEPFQHFFIQNDGQLALHQNSWKQAKIGELSSLHDVCLQLNGLHLTRKCHYDYKEHKPKWASVDHLKDVKCLQNARQQIIGGDLNLIHENITITNYLHKDVKFRRNTTTSVLTLLRKPKTKILPVDVQLTSEILKDLVTDSQDADLSTDILKITHNIMSTDPSVLRMSAEVNATNCLLETFENYMDALTENFVSETHCQKTIPILNEVITNTTENMANDSVEILNLSNIGVYAHIAHNISVFFVNPSCASISGIAIYDQQQQQQHHTKSIHYDSYNDFYYRYIYMNESVNDLLHETHLELASFIPTTMWLVLKEYFSLLGRSPVVVFKIYAHDGLFVEQTLLRSRRPFSKIVSISIPGFEVELPEHLPFILQNKSPTFNVDSSANTGCGYWNYNTWTSSGVETINSSESVSYNDLILCYTTHLTQFSYLLGGSFKQNDLTDEILVTPLHQQALDIISLIGCTLSLLGLMGIWVTAIFLKSFRSQASNKVLLNMCVALTLQMVLFLFVNTDDISETLVEEHYYTRCIILGALLQYSILVLFTWMLIIAFFQFQRYVTVIGIQRPKHYIIKSAIVAWGLPLVPTLLVALLDSKSYIPNTYQLVTDTGICYPSGNSLVFGVLLPISLIILINLIIFLYVFYSISHTLSMSMQRNEKKMVIKQVRLSVLLFFLLGLSWIFGIFAFMKAGIVFSYLFCLTATLQGFVMFIYFVILDQGTRNAWQTLLCPSGKKKSQDKKSTELQSMTTATTSYSHDTSTTRGH